MLEAASRKLKRWSVVATRVFPGMTVILKVMRGVVVAYRFTVFDLGALVTASQQMRRKKTVIYKRIQFPFGLFKHHMPTKPAFYSTLYSSAGQHTSFEDENISIIKVSVFLF